MREEIRSLHGAVLKAAEDKRWETLVEATEALRLGLGEALCDAARDGNEAECRELIEFGADVNFVRKQGLDRPAHLAAAGGHIAILELLDASGAILAVENRNEKLPTDLAKDGGHRDCLDFLSRLANCEERFVEYAGRGLLDKMMNLLDSGVDIDCRVDGKTALIAAAGNFRLEAVDLLVAHGASVNAVDETSGKTPLHFLANLLVKGKYAWNKVPESIAKLIAAGADIDAADGEGKTPLYFACLSHVRYGAGNNAAGNNAPRKVARILVDAGADPQAMDSSGNRPIDLARRGKGGIDLELVAVLERASLSKNLDDQPVSADDDIDDSVFSL